MQTVLSLIALAAVAYVLAHFVVERLQARFLVTSGVEYVILGLLIGPQMPWGAALSAEALQGLHPVMSLVIGGVGLLFGLQANFRALLTRQDDAGQLALTVFITTGAMVGAGTWLLLQTRALGGFGADEAAAGAWVLASSAAVSSSGAMALVRRRFGAQGPLTHLLDGTMRAAELLAIAAFGVVFAVFHAPDPAHGDWTYANWLLVTLGLGVGLGLLFRLFIGDGVEDEDHIFLAVLGIIVFASGAAYALQLSPLLVNLVLGTTLSNVARCHDVVLAAMERQHRTVTLMLLVLAGALWTPIPVAGLVLVVAYLLLRFAAKLLGGVAAASSAEGRLPRDVGRGLLGHGDVAIAMAVSYRIVFDGPVVDLVFTCIVASVVLSELTAARQLMGLLIDSGDIRREGPGAGPSLPTPGEGNPTAEGA